MYSSKAPYVEDKHKPIVAQVGHVLGTGYLNQAKSVENKADTSADKKGNFGIFGGNISNLNNTTDDYFHKYLTEKRDSYRTVKVLQEGFGYKYQGYGTWENKMDEGPSRNGPYEVVPIQSTALDCRLGTYQPLNSPPNWFPKSSHIDQVNVVSEGGIFAGVSDLTFHSNIN